MPITEELKRLGQSVHRLNEGSEEINALVADFDRILGELLLPFDYLHPRPLRETTIVGREGKRVIEVAYLGYLPYRGQRHLVVKTVKVVESKAAAAEGGGQTLTPLLLAPRPLRHAAVDVLEEVASAIRRQLDELADEVDRRRGRARAAVDGLEAVRDRASSSSSSGRRPRVDEG
ncbi:MAG: hypothetical protein KC420_04810 [Myxococcales bacterium]|nr:hypothetical protein [Myxococcales bacterium]MCB9568580.1 hypothetical protein [Myxococcales bacterium]MCB9701960.1 hypothetical protein [Myxococcales bacterium]